MLTFEDQSPRRTASLASKWLDITKEANAPATSESSEEPMSFRAVSRWGLARKTVLPAVKDVVTKEVVKRKKRLSIVDIVPRYNLHGNWG